MEITTGQYRGLNYTVETDENYSGYCIYEFTPIFHQKCDIMLGSTASKNIMYTEEYVKRLIDNCLLEVEKCTDL